MGKKLYQSTSEVARELAVSSLTVINYCKSGKLIGKQNPINKRWLVLKSSVKNLFREKEVKR
jgi:hypothetical protein